MERQIKDILIDIATTAYNEKPQYFKLDIVVEEMKSRHGDYCPSTKTIRIFNLSRPSAHIISTTIHELAHHIDYCKYKSTGHNKRFYGIFKKLLETAIKLGYVEYSSVRNKEDSIDIIMMEKYYGPITVKYDEKMDKNKDKTLLKVKNSYKIKDFLSENGYKYDGISKTWNKTIDDSEVQSEKEKIIDEDPLVEFDEVKFNKIEIDSFYYIVTKGNMYEHRESLKEHGYIYKGYRIKTNDWVKKISAKDLNEEKIFLEKKQIQYRIRNKIY